MDTAPWELLNRVFTVERIMTLAERLLKWEEGTPLDGVVDEAEAKSYDLIPVKRGERIVGVMRRESAPAWEQLTPEWLVSASTGVGDLFELLATCGKPGLLVLSRQEVVGIVTRGDLNKIEARAYVYNLIGQLEIGLASVLRAEISDDSQVLSLLPEKNRNKVNGIHKKLEKADVHAGIIECMFIDDLLIVAGQVQALSEPLGLASPIEVKTVCEAMTELRNSTMHLARRFVGKDIVDLGLQHERVKEAIRMISLLAPLIATSVVAEGT